jgi:acetyl-CoA synthetase
MFRFEVVVAREVMMAAGTQAPQPIVWEPTAERIKTSNIAEFMRLHGVPDFEALCRRAESDPEWWWRAIADRIDFFRHYDLILDVGEGVPFARWCVGGTTNIVHNALDRHRGTDTWHAPAILGELESGDARQWTYAQLSNHTSQLASGLRHLGIRAGEVVAVYMPNVNEAVAGMLAITKIGAVAMPLFSGFGVEAVYTRLLDSGAVAILTVESTTRRGRPAPMKAVADQAADRVGERIRHVICLNSSPAAAQRTVRDVDWKSLCEGRPTDAPTEEVDAEATALLVYTSGTSGKPKGTVHSHAGFAAKLSLDLGLMMDMKPSDRIVWMSDMGWLVGPILTFGATIIGASFVLAEGAPDYPDPYRLWRLVEKHRVTFLGVAPTLIRGFMHGAGIGPHDISSLRVCVSTGEAWTPDAWWWTFDKVLGRQHPIINYTGGTEIGGGILSGTVVHPMKPGAFSGPIPGMGADIVDDQGHSVGPNTVGELVLRRPSIGLSRGLWNDRERYLDSYWRDIPGVWRQGDWAYQDEDGFYYVLGRSDDTLKIAGKRTGPSEIESLLTATGKVAEAAVIGIPDPLKGEAVACVVVVAPGVPDDAETKDELSNAVVAGLGQPYRPQLILTVGDLPKTRNMKVMRRIVRAALLGKPLGDTSSLVNPEAVAAVQQAAQPLGPHAANVRT